MARDRNLTDRVYQAAFRYAKEHDLGNRKQREKFADKMRRAFIELPPELRRTIDLAFLTAERRADEAAKGGPAEPPPLRIITYEDWKDNNRPYVCALVTPSMTKAERFRFQDDRDAYAQALREEHAGELEPADEEDAA